MIHHRVALTLSSKISFGVSLGYKLSSGDMITLRKKGPQLPRHESPVPVPPPRGPTCWLDTNTPSQNRQPPLPSFPRCHSYSSARTLSSSVPWMRAKCSAPPLADPDIPFLFHTQKVRGGREGGCTHCHAWPLSYGQTLASHPTHNTGTEHVGFSPTR